MANGNSVQPVGMCHSHMRTHCEHVQCRQSAHVPGERKYQSAHAPGERELYSTSHNTEELNTSESIDHEVEVITHCRNCGCEIVPLSSSSASKKSSPRHSWRQSMRNSPIQRSGDEETEMCDCNISNRTVHNNCPNPKHTHMLQNSKMENIDHKYSFDSRDEKSSIQVNHTKRTLNQRKQTRGINSHHTDDPD